MTKNTVLFVLLFAVSCTLSAQKCKIKNDPFTDERVVSFDYGENQVQYELRNNEISLDIVFNYWGERDYEFQKGATVFLKLENGDKMKLVTVFNSQPKIEEITSTETNVLGFGGFNNTSAPKTENFTAYVFSFTLTKAELNQLSESRIEVIRIPETQEGKYVDLEAKGRTKKKIKAVQKGAKCIFENL